MLNAPVSHCVSPNESDEQMTNKTRCRTAGAGAKTRGEDAAPGLRPLVKERVYSVWLDMLKQLVPQGRTHRLSVFVAGCLQYAVGRAGEK
jgi:hypothetical protein